MDSYIARQKYQALVLVSTWAEAMSGGKESQSSTGTPKPKPKGDKVPAAAMWAMLGAPKRKTRD